MGSVGGRRSARASSPGGRGPPPPSAPGAGSRGGMPSAARTETARRGAGVVGAGVDRGGSGSGEGGTK